MARKNPLYPSAEEAACAALENALRAIHREKYPDYPDAGFYHAALGRLIYHAVQIAEGDRHQQQRSIDALREWIKASAAARLS